MELKFRGSQIAGKYFEIKNKKDAMRRSYHVLVEVSDDSGQTWTKYQDYFRAKKNA